MSEFSAEPFTPDDAHDNLNNINFNLYIGNTVMIGLSSDGVSFQQVCWLYGRSDAEKNRRFEIAQERGQDFVQTIRETEGGSHNKPIYTMLSYADKSARRNLHVVTTSDKTRAIIGAMVPDTNHGRLVGQPFGTNFDWYEPEATPTGLVPRVSGLLDIGVGTKDLYGKKETKVNYNLLTRGRHSEVSERSLRHEVAPGVALAAHAFNPHSGAPDHFEGAPYALPLQATAELTRDFYWERLPAKYRVAIAVVAIYGSERTYSVKNA